MIVHHIISYVILYHHTICDHTSSYNHTLRIQTPPQSRIDDPNPIPTIGL